MRHTKEYTKVWKREQEKQENEDCGLALYPQKKGSLSYIDNVGIRNY